VNQSHLLGGLSDLVDLLFEIEHCDGLNVRLIRIVDGFS